MRADLNNFWWTWEPTWRTFKKEIGCLFFLADFFSEFTTEISFCEFGFFFCQKKLHHNFRKFAMLAPRSTKNYSNRPVSRVTKNYSVSCLVLLVEAASLLNAITHNDGILYGAPNLFTISIILAGGMVPYATK